MVTIRNKHYLCTFFCTWLIVLVPLKLLADDNVNITDVAPQQANEFLVCRLGCVGLPGEKLLQSMQSGLISAIDFNLVVIDESKREVGGNRISLRLSYDLWEETYFVENNQQKDRFPTLGKMADHLHDLELLQVMPLSGLKARARYRLRVVLFLHPIAPKEEDYVGQLISGGQRPRSEGEANQEASISMGHLIRFFYKGSSGSGGSGELTSRWFTKEELSDASH